MKRYLVFAGLHYYPNGGWEDFYFDYDTLEEAWAYLPSEQRWYQIVDTTIGDIVAAGQIPRDP